MMTLLLWLALLVPTCAPNADGIIVCPSTRPPAVEDAPAWIVEAMRSGTACELGVDIYATVPGDEEDWYAWREAHPEARIIERVQPADASIPDSWLYEADGEYVVFVFNEKLAQVRRGFVVEVHGLCARLINA
jgi:hypothetical protein